MKAALRLGSTGFTLADNRTAPLATPDDIIARARDVVLAEQRALALLGPSLGSECAAACQAIFAMERQLIVSGIGKSGHIARKVAATFAATGTPAIFVHPSEAGHGDLGMLRQGDVLLVLSNSGNTYELLPILAYADKIGIPVIGVCTRRQSKLVEFADILILLPALPEACSKNITPTTSSIMQLAIGDALALTVMDMRGVSHDQLQSLHPSGSIGLASARVADIMHRPGRLPLVGLDTCMPETISVMTQGCLGVAGVIDATGALVGIITDGDVRRGFATLGSACAQEVMSAQPLTIAPDMTAADVLALFSANRISVAFVVKDPAAGPQPPLGVVHLNDLLRQGLG
jgi:arabinose-5-phosphate isomerase